MSAWRGRSGRRYIVGVRSGAGPENAELTDAVVLAVARDRDGSARLLDVAVPCRGSSRMARLGWLATMRARGATELHVHLLADTAADRDRGWRDLAERTM